jgi:hypothetical protein
VLIRFGESDVLELWAGDSAAPLRVSVADFSNISALRWCPEPGELIITAVQADGVRPDVRGNLRGDLRLHRCAPAAGRWEQVWSGYAHDPICLPDGYAVHRGAGVTILDHSGGVEREIKVGRFNWGPPSLSVNYAGDRVAWTRWVGDDQKPRLENLSDGTSSQARSSVYRYGWWDDRTLAYYHGTGLRLLGITSGRTRALPWDLRAALHDQVVGAPPEFVRLASAPRDATWESFGELIVDSAGIWFTAFLAATPALQTGWEGPTRVEGLFRLSRDLQHAALHTHVVNRRHMGSVTVLPDGSAAIEVLTYDDQVRVAHRELEFVGLSRGLLAEGWMPAPESHQPSFAFHQMPT